MFIRLCPFSQVAYLAGSASLALHSLCVGNAANADDALKHARAFNGGLPAFWSQIAHVLKSAHMYLAHNTFGHVAMDAGLGAAGLIKSLLFSSAGGEGATSTPTPAFTLRAEACMSAHKAGVVPLLGNLLEPPTCTRMHVLQVSALEALKEMVFTAKLGGGAVGDAVKSDVLALRPKVESLEKIETNVNAAMLELLQELGLR